MSMRRLDKERRDLENSKKKMASDENTSFPGPAQSLYLCCRVPLPSSAALDLKHTAHSDFDALDSQSPEHCPFLGGLLGFRLSKLSFLSWISEQRDTLRS